MKLIEHYHENCGAYEDPDHELGGLLYHGSRAWETSSGLGQSLYGYRGGQSHDLCEASLGPCRGGMAGHRANHEIHDHGRGHDLEGPDRAGHGLESHRGHIHDHGRPRNRLWGNQQGRVGRVAALCQTAGWCRLNLEGQLAGVGRSVEGNGRGN